MSVLSCLYVLVISECMFEMCFFFYRIMLASVVIEYLTYTCEFLEYIYIIQTFHKLEFWSQFLVIFLQLVGAAFGAAGQRCMALTTVVWVGESKQWIPEMIERAKKLRVAEGL